MSEQTVELTVEGMSCSHCTGRVQKALEAFEAVKKVEIDLAAKKVAITYDTEVLNQQDLVEVISEQGYEVL